MIAYHRHLPRPPLSEFIEVLWLYENAQPSHRTERVLPTGTVELVINLRDDAGRSFDSVVAGPHSRFFMLDSGQPVSVIGAHFKAGGAFPFFALPMDELRNQHVPLDMLWGKGAVKLRELLLSTKTCEARLQQLEHVLVWRLRRGDEGHPAVRHALRTLGHRVRRVAGVVDEIGMTQRRFIRLFSTEVGLTPKAFCRIRRFQHAIALLDGRKEVQWADVALECGYYDQSHMVHDFHDFAGLSPANYLARRGPFINHVPE
jgi:AraC-like DNA-binding protein